MKYTRKFRDYFHIDKKLDIEHYGYNKEDVDDALSDIDYELYQIEDDLLKGLIGNCIQKIEQLREKL